ncbi:ABC transporter ATP-binding protein [Psychromonas sp. CNPT3]|uniref:ATP-binding cassette domain-containing protein n=1 Tax=Psychromonas sp. CNPT3 TaxID=314282 RepID=UPI00006E4836|nr:ABC transporter ATP-binding protein [Psychromonas sp. CNPT3]AGH81265.1 ABC transporter ATP-binding protein [Psychromonas sp. CNPT3]
MTILLQVKDLCKNYRRSAGFFRSTIHNAYGPLNFTLEKGETLSLVGESGSGKSSLVKSIAGLRAQSSGEIYLHGQSLEDISQQQRCQSIRMIFQDPSDSLNPKATIRRILGAPLELNSDLSMADRDQQLQETLDLVGLQTTYLDFYPNMLSAMQQHQVAIARAMILNPDIVVADEIFATLDISLRFKIVNLLLDIQRKKGLSYIFVAHNMNLVRHMSDRVIVMHKGKIIENNSSEAIFNDPQNSITKFLLQSHAPDYKK